MFLTLTVLVNEKETLILPENKGWAKNPPIMQKLDSSYRETCLKLDGGHAVRFISWWII